MSEYFSSMDGNFMHTHNSKHCQENKSLETCSIFISAHHANCESLMQTYKILSTYTSSLKLTFRLWVFYPQNIEILRL